MEISMGPLPCLFRDQSIPKMALFKLDNSRKCQIFCPWTGYFLGLFWDIPGWIKLILPSLPFLQSWEGKENHKEALLILIIALRALIILEILKPSFFGSLSMKAFLFKDLLNWRFLELYLQHCPPPGMGAGMSSRLKLTEIVEKVL